MTLKNTHTEDEMRQKWCPFDGISESDGILAHKRNVTCSASDCGCWRWVLTPENQNSDNPEGYCGAAGTP
ncbi:MAG TPA: hypothetical protein VIV09_15665 [Pseudolabrys sp.]